MLLYFAIGGLLLLVLFIVFFKPIRLFLIKLFLTHYSFSYVRVFRKYFYKNPFVHCIKDSFEHRARHFHEHEKNSQFFTTKADISFNKIPFYTSFAKIKKIKQKPYCFNAYKLGKHYVKVIGYKESLAQLGCNVLFYFLDKKFFLGEYVFKDPTEKTVKNILTLLQDKYIDKKQDIVEIENSKFYITHDNGSRIFYRYNGFSVTISYINIKAGNLQDKFDDVFKTLSKNFEDEQEPEQIIDSMEENPF